MKKKDWYSPHSIRYTKPQVRWLLPHLALLRSGVWPRNPKETGYTDPAISKAPLKAGAKFELPTIIAAELDVRIQAAGVDGLMMEFLYAFEPDDELFVIEHMAQCLNLSRREATQRIRNALYFVSGADRKKSSYKDFIRDAHKYLRLK